jgi:hypothetical protein
MPSAGCLNEEKQGPAKEDTRQKTKQFKISILVKVISISRFITFINFLF